MMPWFTWKNPVEPFTAPLTPLPIFSNTEGSGAAACTGAGTGTRDQRARHRTRWAQRGRLPAIGRGTLRMAVPLSLPPESRAPFGEERGTGSCMPVHTAQ